jgi:VanZ family protein
MTRRLLRFAGWMLAASVVILSVVPPTERPVTPFPHKIEHLGIFLLTGLAFGLGYQTRHLVQALSLVAFSATIEIVQLGIPGRHARLSDFVVDAVSAIVGTGLAVVISPGKSASES